MELDPKYLNETLPNFDFSNPPTDPVELAHTLAKAMISHKGVGLAANQIGLPYRAFAVTGQPIMVMFNAKIISASEDEVLLPEGCLSFPGLFVKVKRPKSVRVRYTLPNGDIQTQVFDGLTARIIQHELDHMNGQTFYDRATRFHLEQARRQAKRKK